MKLSRQFETSSKTCAAGAIALCSSMLGSSTGSERNRICASSIPRCAQLWTPPLLNWFQRFELQIEESAISANVNNKKHEHSHQTASLAVSSPDRLIRLA